MGSSTRTLAPVGMPAMVNEKPTTWFDRRVVRHLDAALVVEVEADSDAEHVGVVRREDLGRRAAQAHRARRRLRERRREAPVARVRLHGGRRERDGRARARRVHPLGLASAGRRAVGAPVVAVGVPGALDAQRVAARTQVAVRVGRQRHSGAARAGCCVPGRRGTRRRAGGAGRRGRRRGRARGGRVVSHGALRAPRVVTGRRATQAPDERTESESRGRDPRLQYPVFHETPRDG